MNNNWRPTCTVANLRKRANILRTIREFMYNEGVLEVDTPLLNQYGTTDPHLASIEVNLNNKKYFLPTSPEYAMKRLLACGSGSIYQISKAFRHDEQSALHNYEFTMLEWYEININHLLLIEKIIKLIKLIFPNIKINTFTYKDLFAQFAKINITSATIKEYQLTLHNKISSFIVNDATLNLADWQMLLFSELIQPQLKQLELVIVTDFPIIQRALAKVATSNQEEIAERFEIFYQGIELANGYHEETSLAEHQIIFAQHQAERKQKNLPCMQADPLFLAAIEHGIPNCAGVAIGFDRLLMCKLQQPNISTVLYF